MLPGVINKRLVLTILVVTNLLILIKLKKIIYDYPESHAISGVLPLKQPDNITCGPTSMAMVLNFYGQKASIEEVKNIAHTHWFFLKGKSVGMTAPDLLAKSGAYFGVNFNVEFGTADSLKQTISRNIPVILLVRSGEKIWHYIVITGYGPDYFLVNDPGCGWNLKVSEQVIMDSWAFDADLSGDRIMGYDFYRKIVELGDVYNNIMLVPER